MKRTRTIERFLIILVIFSVLAVFQGGTNCGVEQIWATDWDRERAFLEIGHKALPAKEWSTTTANIFRVEVFNSSDVNFRDVSVAITLPEGLNYVKGSNAESLGYMAIGERRKIDFPIGVEKNAESKSYAISVDVNAVGYLGESWSTTRVFYIPVEGEPYLSSDDISISNIVLPSTVESENDFTLTFQVANSGKVDTKRLKISVDGGDGLVNKTQNIFLEPRIEKGRKKGYAVTFHALQTETPRSNAIKITVEADSGEKNAITITQYGMVYISALSKDSIGVKQLQLVVDKYSFGGKSIKAGDEFTLNLRLHNTSNVPLSNIKASLSSDGEAFVPMGGSNSFYADSIAAKGYYDKNLRLSASPQAEQKSVPIILSLTYEDGKGNSYEASETLAIPVIQSTRLTWDEPVQPMECYVGMPSSAEIEFYNLGKGILYNLRVNATGNFDTNESNSYYVGNMEGGNNDSYDFHFIPREPGSVEGIITFTYEDAAGNQHIEEAVFSFPVNEAFMPPDEFEDFTDETDQMSKKGIGIGIGTVVLAIVVISFIYRKWRRKKEEQMLAIDD